MNAMKLFGSMMLISWGLLSTLGCSSSGGGGTTTGNPLVADTSSSGAVAGAVGGALSGSSASGTVAAADFQVRFAQKVSTESTTCPTFLTAQGSGCDASGSAMWLSYSTCKFANSTLTFNGVQSLTMSAGSATCGSFPNPGSGNTLTRQYVSTSGGTTSSYLSIKDTSDISTYVDNHTANLGNFNSDTLATIANGGYGVQVDFSGTGGTRNAVTLGHRVYITGGFDQSIYGNFSVAESAGSSTRNLSGSLTVYHNALEIIGTSVLSNLVHSDMCCLPISGSITTTFRAGSTGPTALGSLYVGKSETLTFTGCGTGTLQNYDGSVQSVSLGRCF